MSASLCGNMRGPQVKTTLLLLLLLTSLTGTVSCQDETGEENGTGDIEVTSTAVHSPAEPTTEPGVLLEPSSTARTQEPDLEPEESGSGFDQRNSFNYSYDSTDFPNEEDDSSLIIVIAAVLGAGLITAIVGGILFYRLCNKKVINQELSKEDPYLEASSTEKVPMPMFEEDVPSVQELEMEELDQWMKKDDSSTAN